MSAGSKYKGGGATWRVDCRWQVRLLDAEGEPLTTWRYADTLRDCRDDLAGSDADRAEVKHDGDRYGDLIRTAAGRPRLIRTNTRQMESTDG